MINAQIDPPPEGSVITVITTEDGSSLITIPQAASGTMRYFIGAFLILWLGGWVFGFISVVSRLLAGKANTFFILWLGGWSIGGIFVIYFLYRLFRPTVPETLRLSDDGVAYDSGIPPFRMYFGLANQMEALRSLFPKRMVVTLNRQQLETLSLRVTGAGNRLTIDVGAKRISVGESAGEIEREWLHKLIAERYS
jgi:hypothetical protein